MKYDELSAVLSYDYARYGDLFEDMLNDEEFLMVGEPTADLTEDEKRVLIFREALKEEKGLRWVNEKLSAEKLRALYSRNPLEFALKHCLLCNDSDNAYRKYNHKAFLALWKEIKPEMAFLGVKLATEKNGSQKMITFGTLREFVLTSSREKEQQNGLATEDTYTSLVEQELERIDVTQPTAYDVFRHAFANCCNLLCETSQPTRYYFAKYIYYIICHQIMELKEILTEFTFMKPMEFLAKIKDGSRTYYKWSLRKCMLDHTEVENLVYKEDVDKQPSKVLLKALLDYFVLKGASTTSAHMGLLEPGDQLSVLRNKTQIFKDGTDREKHEAFVVAIQEMKLSDFYGYAINFNKLFHLLFERILDKEVTWTDDTQRRQDYRKKYIVGVLNGQYDMSRSAVLLFLASAKGALFDVENLKLNKDVLFNDSETLELTRTNHMLNRMGYVNVGDDCSYEQSDQVDGIYFEIFDAPHTELVALDSFSDTIAEFVAEYGFNPIPFELSEITAKTRRENIIKEKNS